MEITAQLVSPSMNAKDKSGLAKRVAINIFENSPLAGSGTRLDVAGELQCQCCLLDGGDSLKVDALWHFSTKSKKE